MGRKEKLIIGFVSCFALPLFSAEEAYFLSLREVISETLHYQWSILTSELNIDTQAGLLEQSQGAFNPFLSSSFAETYLRNIQSAIGLKTKLKGTTTTSSLSLQTLTRLGTTYGVSFNNTNTKNPLTPPRTDASNVTVSVTQPVLRNLLWSPQTTLEKTLKLQVKVAQLQNVQNIAQAVTNSINAYWEFVAAKKILVIRLQQEALLRKLENYAQDLVDEQQEGYATLYQPRADLALSVSNRIQAEQDVKSTYYALLLNMGLVPSDNEGLPPVDVEPFPFSEKLCQLNQKWYHNLVKTIPDARTDLLASNLLIKVADLNLTSAKNALLPELDVNGSVEWQNTTAAQKAKLYESASLNDPQKDYTIGASFTFPIFNDAAKGLVKQARAAKSLAVVNYSLLESDIISSFKTAFTLYNALFWEIQKLRYSANQYEKTVDSEVLKLQEGLSSYFFVLSLQGNWETALLQQVINEKLFVQNLTQVKLLVGKLIKADSLSQEIMVDDVIMSMDLFVEEPCQALGEELEKEKKLEELSFLDFLIHASEEDVSWANEEITPVTEEIDEQ